MNDLRSTFLPLAVAACVSTIGCASLAIATAPDKQAVHDDSAGAKVADAAFWSTLHGGHYEQIGGTLDLLEAAYLARPNDPKTAAHIGFLHIWRVSERERMETVPPTVTDDIALARRYFDEAVRLDAKDARIHGFLAATMLAEGRIHSDEKLTRKGFFEMQDAVSEWPEFNLFTRGYAMSGLPFDHERYAGAVEDQWATLDTCAHGERIDRKTADFAPYMGLETRTGRKRTCWNSWIAPHNFEGFFLNMGDMIVKAGDPKTARKVYAQAKLSKEYSAWPYRDVLDRRIAQADENVTWFRTPAKGDKERRIMGDSAFACTGCHQQ
ncbi:hypothetical protein LVJ94_26735 [Pendulispora rubella]|uniref:Uncharacterized protein n=1 Tax=Pendulispora rubella TaxID=2741070 RepID=A0ABZ2KTZ0_9BACT